MDRAARYVVDASVALKWFLRDRDDEASTEHALALLKQRRDFPALKAPFVQPVHFVAEVASVLARVKAEEAEDDLADLLDLDFQIENSPTIYRKAVALSKQYQHHLFDTLYHAVALSVGDATLVTADERYFRKACGEGSIVLLNTLSIPH